MLCTTERIYCTGLRSESEAYDPDIDSSERLTVRIKTVVTRRSFRKSIRSNRSAALVDLEHEMWVRRHLMVPEIDQ